MITGFASLALLGVIGELAAFREWWTEFRGLEERHGPDAEWPWAERRRMLPWTALVLIFGSAAVIGIVGLVGQVLR